MNIEQALIDIALKYDFDADTLIGYAYEDTVGGYHPTPTLAKWPTGSVWDVEGRVVYALVRALRPKRILLFGSDLECIYTHINSAQPAGAKDIVRFTDKGRDYLLALRPAEWTEIGLIFEDGNHTKEDVRDVWELAKDNLPAGAVVISHDAAHPTVGKAIRDGIIEAGVNARVYAVQPSDCGLAVWRKPFGEEPKPAETVSEQLDAALNEGSAKAQQIRDDWRQFVPVMDEPESEEKPSVVAGREFAEDFKAVWKEGFEIRYGKAKAEPDVTLEDLPDLSSMTRAELREYAETLGIEGAQTMSKKALLGRLTDG